MAKRKKATEKLTKYTQFKWRPSEDLLPPRKPSKRYSHLEVKGGVITTAYEFCDTHRQYKLHLIADKLLRNDGFFEERDKMRDWVQENYDWVIAANPHAITTDGHLSASAAFC